MTAREWALPVGARQFRARWAGTCALCDSPVQVGDLAWPNAAGGVVCPECKETRPPTFEGVLSKIQRRIDVRKPVNLTLDDVSAIVEAATMYTDLCPSRQGDESAWSRYRADPALTLNVQDVFGLAYDAVEHRFQPNFPTAPLVELLHHILELGTLQRPVRR